MKKIALVLLLMVVVVGCGPKKPVTQDPGEDPFFEKARLIMTKEEQAIYKHLPDEEAKSVFLVEFWQKRDPTPDTEENENLIEFESRIAYANRWFREGKGQDRGWDSERGRVLLQIGFPDDRYFGDYTQADPYTGALRSTQRIPMERWIYYRFNLVLTFADRKGFGELRMIRVPAGLLTALDLTKFSLDLRNKSDLKRAFRFKADYRDGALEIEIPIKKLSFEGSKDEMIAKFKIDIHVYKDYQKLELVTQEKTITRPKAEILALKTFSYKVPYVPKERGDYYFDVIITELTTGSKFRNFCNYKFK